MITKISFLTKCYYADLRSFSIQHSRYFNNLFPTNLVLPYTHINSQTSNINKNIKFYKSHSLHTTITSPINNPTTISKTPNPTVIHLPKRTPQTQKNPPRTPKKGPRTSCKDSHPNKLCNQFVQRSAVLCRKRGSQSHISLDTPTWTWPTIAICTAAMALICADVQSLWILGK